MSITEYEIDNIYTEIEYDYERGSRNYFDKTLDNWYPGDESVVTLKRVWLRGTKGQKDLDILPYLNESLIERIELDILEDIESESL